MSGGSGECRTLDAVLRDMVGRMAHELKNPLQAIVVNVEVLRTGVRSGRDPDRPPEPFATAIEEGVRVLDRRLRLLFLVSRAADEDPVSADPLQLAEDLVGGLALDRGPRAITVARDSWEGGSTLRLRAGRFVACLVRLLDRARELADGPVRVGYGSDIHELEVRFEGRGPEGEDERGAGWNEVVVLARVAGLELSGRAEGGSRAFRLRFPEG